MDSSLISSAKRWKRSSKAMADTGIRPYPCPNHRKAGTPYEDKQTDLQGNVRKNIVDVTTMCGHRMLSPDLVKSLQKKLRSIPPKHACGLSVVMIS